MITTSFPLFLGLAALATLVASLISLQLGLRFLEARWMRPLGKRMYRQKMRSMETTWPLTRLGAALEERDFASVRVIVTALIAVKSLASFLAGIVVVPWLPLASFLVPAIVASHDPESEASDHEKAELQQWVLRVSRWQVTSHVLAAAPGFTLVWLRLATGSPIGESIEANPVWISAFLIASACCALVAGQAEAKGLMKHWK